jgi:hypothetical protein
MVGRNSANANCPKAQAFSIYDRCRVRYERYRAPLSSCVDAERSGLLAGGEVGAFAAAQANADQAEGTTPRQHPSRPSTLGLEPKKSPLSRGLQFKSSRP